MIHFLTLGGILGLSAGFAPGPLLALVISETLRHNVGAGIKVALSPMATDLPIVVATVAILSELSGFHGVLGAISLAGGLFVLFMGYESLTAQGIALEADMGKPQSFVKGLLTNALSPYPYLFWIGVGAPILTQSLTLGIGAPLAFLVGFYSLMVGAKIALALLVGQSRSFLTGKIYRSVMRVLGLILIGLAGALFYDGWRLLRT